MLPFASKTEPTITMDNYVKRCMKFGKASPEALICTLICMGRVWARQRCLPDKYTMHRLFGVALMVCSKLYDDIYYNNRWWAKVLGLDLSELNDLEVKFVTVINFELHVERPEYQTYQTAAVNFRLV